MVKVFKKVGALGRIRFDRAVDTTPSGFQEIPEEPAPAPIKTRCADSQSAEKPAKKKESAFPMPSFGQGNCFGRGYHGRRPLLRGY